MRKILESIKSFIKGIGKVDILETYIATVRWENGDERILLISAYSVEDAVKRIKIEHPNITIIGAI